MAADWQVPKAAPTWVDPRGATLDQHALTPESKISRWVVLNHLLLSI